MRFAKMPATEHIISTFEFLLYFSKAAYKKTYAAAELQEFYDRHLGKPWTL
jgi:hypothetical protein